MQVHRRFIQVDGIQTHYLESGEGRPVVLLHSGEFGGCAELSWEFTIPKLAERYRVVAPDWLGFGETDKLYDFGGGQARLIKHMRRFIEIMNLDEADFVGNSMGGSIFANAVATNPAAYRLRSLILISSGGFMPDNEHRRRILDYDGTRESMQSLLRAMFVDSRWSEDASYVARRVEISLRLGAWEAVAAARFKNPAVATRQQFGRSDETPYGNIPVPALIIAGKEDKLRLPGYARELAERFNDAELHVIEGSGHCPHIERADDVNLILLKFLARMDARKPSGRAAPIAAPVSSETSKGMKQC
jgi:pimeloyl-ACP methyl ester carboxylesterase